MQPSSALADLVANLLDAEEPVARLSALSELRRELDVIETDTVADALRAGRAWREIGAALGISKQAAHRRHSKSVSELDHAVVAESAGRAALVSDGVRQAVRIAREESARAGLSELGTEHLLLGILQCDDPQTSSLLAQLGVSPQVARSAVESTLELPVEAARAARQGHDSRSGQVILSQLTHRVLSDALSATLDRGTGCLTTLDLLHAVLIHDHGGAARTLAALGVSPALVRAEIETIKPQRVGSART